MISLTELQLQQIIAKTTELAVQRTLEKTGVLRPRITLSEAYRIAGSRTEVDRAIRMGKLKTVKKGGKTSKLWILRSEFDAWLLRDELSNILTL